MSEKGHFLLTDKSSSTFTLGHTHKARIRTPTFPIKYGSSGYCLSWYYHLFGSQFFAGLGLG